MGCRILELLALIEAAAHDPALVNHHGSDGHLILLGSVVGLG